MALHPDFPTNPYVVLDSNIRSYPGEEVLAEKGYEMLLPPLVHQVRQSGQPLRTETFEI